MVDDPSDMDYLLDAVHGLDMRTLDNGFSIEDSNRALDVLSGDMVNMRDDLAGLLSELVDQAGDARTENVLLHAGGMAQRAGMWSDMNAGFDELTEGQQTIADRISDVDTTLANVGSMVGARLGEVSERIDEHRQDTTNAIGRLQGEVAITGTHIAGAIHRGSELLSASLAQGFARLNAEEDRRMAELRSDLRKATEMPRENQALEIYKIAAANYAIGDYTQAARDVAEALKLKSNHIPSLILLGKIATRKGKINFARSRLTRALLHSLQQKNAAGFELVIKELGDNYLQRKDPDRAIKLFEKAIDIARKIFPEMVGRLEWERFRIALPVFEERGDDQGIKVKLMRIVKRYPEGWGALKNDKEFNALRERYPYLNFTWTIKNAEEVCENKTYGQEMQWFKEIEVFLKVKVLRIEKMTQEMINVLDILATQVMLIHGAVMKNGGRDLARWTATCQEVFGRVMKTYNELPENKSPTSAVVKKAPIAPERWNFTEAQLASMSLKEYMAVLRKFPANMESYQISHGARGIEGQDENQHVVTNDFTRTLRTGWYEPNSPVRRQEEGNAIYVVVPKANGENWNVRKKGERININAGILFVPRSTLVDERTGSRFVLDREGFPEIDKSFRVKLWDITLVGDWFMWAGQKGWSQFKECAEKRSARAEREFGDLAKDGIKIMQSVLDSDFDEFMEDFKRQFSGDNMSEEKRSIMRQLIVSIYYRWLTNHNYYADGLSSEDTWEYMNMAIERIQMAYKIGLMKPKRLVTAESYWREYFQNNPRMQPSKVIYYDDDIKKAWSEFCEKMAK